MTCAWILGRGGLLGSAIRKELDRHTIREFIPEQSWNWNKDDDCRSGIEKAVLDFANTLGENSWQIYWAAGTSSMASTQEELDRETKILSTLLTCIEKNSVLMTTQGSIMFASSAGAIYAGSTDDVITEESKPAPLNAYGREKLIQEAMLRTFTDTHPHISILIARLSNLYGANQSRTKKQGLLSHMARCILLRTPINIFVPFDTIRDYLHADDAAVRILETLERHESVMKIIASESPVTVAQIIGTFKHITRISPRVMRSTSTLSQSYVHKMKFRSTVLPLEKMYKTSLLIGVAEVMAAERRALQTTSLLSSWYHHPKPVPLLRKNVCTTT